VGAVASAVTVVVVPEVAANDGPPAPEAVPETVASDGSPAPEVIPEMVTEVEETMGATTVVAPSPPHETATGGPTASSDPADVAGELEVVMGQATFHAPGDVSLDEAVSTASWALSQVQRVL
jgi:hypothetical protein